MTLKELQSKAQQHKVAKWYRMSKEQLEERIAIIEKNQKAAPATVKQKSFNKFIQAVKRCESSDQYYFLIKETFEREFPEEWWDDDLSLFAVEVRLSYHFLIKDYHESKVSIPDRVMQRYEDAKKYELSGVNKLRQSCYEEDVTQPQGEDEMATKKKNGKAKKSVKKTKRVKGKKTSNGASTTGLKKQAREKGIKGWYAMNSEELTIVLNSKTSKADMDKITTAAVKRYAEYNKKYLKK